MTELFQTHVLKVPGLGEAEVDELWTYHPAGCVTIDYLFDGGVGDTAWFGSLDAARDYFFESL